MIVSFIEVFTEYLGVMAFMYKVANKKFKWNSIFLGIAVIEYCIVMFSGKFIDNTIGMILIYLLLFLYAKIKISKEWKGAIKSFGIMLIGIPIMQLLVFHVLNVFTANVKDSRWCGIAANCVICMLILLWKEKYLYWLGCRIMQFKEVLLIILFALFFFYLILSYKNDGYVATRMQIQTIGSICGLILVMALWLSSEMEKNQKQEELKVYEMYTKTFEDMITAIRIKQHEFNNHINALKCLQYTVKDSDELIRQQNQYCDEVLQDTRITQLLRLESSPVLSAFLYSKFILAESHNIEVAYEIEPIDVEKYAAIHDFVEIVGIIFDNAVEALDSDIRTETGTKKIILRLSYHENTKLLLEIANASRKYANDELETFFAAGYSSKGINRGVGLSRVKLLTHRYHADMNVANQLYDKENYLSFRIVFSVVYK